MGEDDNIRILAGVRSTEHRGEVGPFDPKGHSSHEKATHAGSISYMIGQAYAVTCEASAPDDNGNMRITCCNIAGMEVAVLDVNQTQMVAELRDLLTQALCAQCSDVESMNVELLGPDGSVLCNDASVSESFAVK